jgi:biotin carboxyl carrier protein
VELEIDGVHRTYTVHTHADVSYVDGPDGSVTLAEVPRFADPDAAATAGSLLAAMPGTVVRVLVDAGEAVAAGQPLVVLEAMKMEHTVAASIDGVVAELCVGQGDQVDTGQVLAVVEEVA